MCFLERYAVWKGVLSAKKCFLGRIGNLPMKTGEDSQPGKIRPARVRKSYSYRNAMARATRVLKKPEKLETLLIEARNKAAKLDKGPIGEARDSIFTLFRLVKAYARGHYRDISWSNLVLVVAALIYFVAPLDMLPDFLLALGYIDDAAILGWTIRAIADELARFAVWESDQGNRPARPVDSARD